MMISDLQLEQNGKWLRGENGGVRLDLGGANLRGADLGGANLRGADLRGADLGGANLRGRPLRRVDLHEADLGGANLHEADLGGANLRAANLHEADLGGANLRGADLRGANLRGADLRDICADLVAVLDAAPSEVPGLLLALREGRVDGSVYEGECACLLGTIANVRGCDYRRLGSIVPDSDRPVERWFLAIGRGATPKNNPVAEITETWIVDWMAAREAAAASPANT